MPSYVEIMSKTVEFVKRADGPRRFAGSEPCFGNKATDLGIYKQISAEDLNVIFKWVDGIPFTRPKKNINRDFSDGVLFSEAVYHFFPKLVELHNYVAACSFAHKKSNWDTLNHKVLTKIGFKLTDQHIRDLCQNKIGAIENALKLLYEVVRDCAAIEKEKALHAEAARGDGSSQKLTQEVICLASEDPESGLQYNGVNMIPEQLLMEYKIQIQELEKTVKNLNIKVKRQETLLQLKESKLQELTLENHELRQMKILPEGKVSKTWVDPTGLV